MYCCAQSVHCRMDQEGRVQANNALKVGLATTRAGEQRTAGGAKCRAKIPSMGLALRKRAWIRTYQGLPLNRPQVQG